MVYVLAFTVVLERCRGERGTPVRYDPPRVSEEDRLLPQVVYHLSRITTFRGVEPHELRERVYDRENIAVSLFRRWERPQMVDVKGV